MHRKYFYNHLISLKYFFINGIHNNTTSKIPTLLNITLLLYININIQKYIKMNLLPSNTHFRYPYKIIILILFLIFTCNTKVVKKSIEIHQLSKKQFIFLTRFDFGTGENNITLKYKYYLYFISL